MKVQFIMAFVFPNACKTELDNPIVEITRKPRAKMLRACAPSMYSEPNIILIADSENIINRREAGKVMVSVHFVTTL